MITNNGNDFKLTFRPQKILVPPPRKPVFLNPEVVLIKQAFYYDLKSKKSTTTPAELQQLTDEMEITRQHLYYPENDTYTSLPDIDPDEPTWYATFLNQLYSKLLEAKPEQNNKIIKIKNNSSDDEWELA